MKDRQLNFTKNKVEVLSLEELAQTVHENYHNGLPVMGIYHFALIEQLLEQLERKSIYYEVKEIFAANNNSKDRPGVSINEQIEAVKGKNVLEAYTLRRVYANIGFKLSGVGDWDLNMAVAYHQSGIQVAFGPMVHICHNQTILDAQDVFSTCKITTASDNNYWTKDVNQLITKVYDYIDQFEERMQQLSAQVTMWKDQPFMPDDFNDVVAALLVARVRHDSAHPMVHTSEQYPLTDKNINAAIERYLVSKAGDGTYMANMSWWDAFQVFNYDLKPSGCEIPKIVGGSLGLANVFKKTFSPNLTES